MALKQSRRTVSLNRQQYELAKELAEAEHKTLSQWVGDLITTALRVRGIVPPTTAYQSPDVALRGLANKANNAKRDRVSVIRRQAQGAG